MNWSSTSFINNYCIDNNLYQFSRYKEVVHYQLNFARSPKHSFNELNISYLFKKLIYLSEFNFPFIRINGEGLFFQWGSIQ